jgi:malate/lactate dehydrogenase
MDGHYDVGDIAISMPTVVGQYGAEQVLDLLISDDERAAFQASANTLKERAAQLRL